MRKAEDLDRCAVCGNCKVIARGTSHDFWCERRNCYVFGGQYCPEFFWRRKTKRSLSDSGNDPTKEAKHGR